jgi:ubiquinone/menaquinone biosynthesis C-methylase UbiE
MTIEPEQWQLEGAAPWLYERYLVPAVTLPWAIDLVERIRVSYGDRVLDVACGTGVVARVAAARVAPGGRVAGLDVNGSMLAVAHSLLPADGAVPIDWYQGSALALPFLDGQFQIVLCQLGVQFFSDRLAALREFRRVLVPGGRVGVSVFSDIEHNPASHALSDALDRHLGQGASRVKRQEHSLSDVVELQALFAASDFADVRVETVVRTVHFACTADYVRVQLAATPLAAQLAGLARSERQRLAELLHADVDASLASYVRGVGVWLPQEVHVALATV